MSARRHIAAGPIGPRHRSRILRALSLACATVLIGAGTAQAVEFQASPTTARSGQAVTFAADPLGATGASLSWAFGDGVTATDANATHAYATPGTYTVTLTAAPLLGEPTATTRTVTVVGEPAAAFAASPSAADVGDAVAFDARASSDPGGAIASYAWSFGDGATGSGAQATHRYATGGDKAVTLTITSGLDGRTATATHTVNVNAPPIASFVYAPVDAPAEQDPLTPIVGQAVRFDGTASGDPDGTVRRWAWDLGTGRFGAATAMPTVVTSFATAGTKDIRLRVTDDRGATSTAKVTLRVNARPAAGFTIAPAAPTTGATVTFASTASDPDGAADIAGVAWDLNGDGTFGDAAGATTDAVFLTAGTYTIGQKVIDRGGASSVATKTVTVAGPPTPVPVDPVVPAVPSPGAPVVVPIAPAGAGDGAASHVADAPGPVSSGAVAGAGAGAAVPRVAGLRALRGVRVQLAGNVTARRTRITRILVLAPRGALVSARCSGKGCPARGVRRRMTASGRLRVAALERTLWSGARVVVSVAKTGFATRRVTLTMRNGRAPARVEGCAAGGVTKVGPCPTR